MQEGEEGDCMQLVVVGRVLPVLEPSVARTLVVSRPDISSPHRRKISVCIPA